MPIHLSVRFRTPPPHWSHVVDRDVICGTVVVRKTPADDPRMLLPRRETGAAVRRIEAQGCDAGSTVAQR